MQPIFRFIPDHALRAVNDICRDFLAAVQQAKKAGRTAEEAAKAWTMPAKYAGYAAPQAARAQANFQVIYNETK